MDKEVIEVIKKQNEILEKISNQMKNISEYAKYCLKKQEDDDNSSLSREEKYVTEKMLKNEWRDLLD